MAHPKTLLIVDDCAADRKIYRRYLAKDPNHSYEIVEADCAADGLLLFQELLSHDLTAPDPANQLILLDYHLPDMSGLEFLDLLREQSATLLVPVIMLTGQGDEAIAVQAIKRGACDYLVKQTLKADVLHSAIRNVLRQAALQTTLYKTQERQRLIATTALRIRQSLDLEMVLQTTVAEVRQLLACDRVLVYQFIADHTGKPEQTGKVVAESVQTGDVAIPCLANCDAYFQAHSFRHRSLEPQHLQQVIANVETAKLHPQYLQTLQQLGIKAKLIVPIVLINEDGFTKLWGLLIAHHCATERQWQPDEVEILEELSVQLAIAIQQAELLAQTQAALDSEKELNQFKSQIIATVSHEYRTPLTAILAAASTLKQHHQSLGFAKQERFLDLIEQKSRQMAKLVEDMLIINQLELQRLHLKIQPLDLSIFCTNLIEEQRRTADENLQFDYQITGNIDDFWGDCNLLQHIFSNLLSNAIKYSPAGGTIAFHLTGTETAVTFLVQDQGIGISQSDQQNLFQLFSRGNNVERIPGTGLGLAIAKACVELYGGSIDLESQIGRGTSVVVRLPKAAGQQG